MNKEQKVNNLIQNGGFVEADRAWLMTLDDAGLTRLESYSAAQIEAVQNAVSAAVEQTTQNEGEEEDAEPTTIEELINGAPAKFQPMLKAGVAAYNAAKEKAITAITANAASGFTKEELNNYDLTVLERMAKLAAGKPATTQNQQTAAPIYSGQAPVVENQGAEGHVEEPLPTPVMNWETTSKK